MSARSADTRETLTVGGLFDGCGLLAYGLYLAGMEHQWLCELDPFRQGILKQRFPGVTVYPDVRAVDLRAARVDLIAGGFPCKGISSNGPRNGFAHPETALWREMLRAVRDIRPRYVLVENVADLLTLHDGECFGEVIGALAEGGYDCHWDCFSAAAFGAPHGRDRVFLTAVADADGARWPSGREPERAEPEWDGDVTHEDPDSAPYAESIGHEVGTALAASEVRQGGNAPAPAQAPTDPDKLGRVELPESDAPRLRGEFPFRDDFAGRRVAVEWDQYEPAISRWEVIVGRPAPEPLLRRMDDGHSGRVERSRLSALGDGVLVQAGWLAGQRIMMHARETGYLRATTAVSDGTQKASGHGSGAARGRRNAGESE